MSVDMLFSILVFLSAYAGGVERVVELLKAMPFYGKYIENWEYQKYVDMGLVIAVSVGVAFLLPPDKIPYVQFGYPYDRILIGLAASLGSNVIHELLAVLKAMRDFFNSLSAR